MLQRQSYDCILLDLVRPGINGIDLFYMIRDRDNASARRVIFITGDTVAKETQVFVESTGSSILNKPFQL